MSPINKSSHHTTNNTKRNRASSFPPSDEQQISSPAVDVTIPLYRPANSCEEIDELFTRQDLTEHDILVFLSGGTLPTKSDHDDDDDVRKTMRREFHQRREEIRKLAEQLKSGEARIDEDGRLVLNDPPRPPRANLPPPPLPGGNNNHANNNHLIDDPLLGNGAFPEANPDGGGGANLTIRRICFAVLAVVTAFVCVILQTLPLMELTDTIDTHFDPLLHELMHIKFLRQHLKNCPDLDRHPPTLPSINASNIWSYRFWQDRLWQVLGLYSETNCDDGVIHIPAKHVLTNNYMYSSPEEAALLEPFRYGVDKIWRIPCHQPPMDVSATSSSPISRCYPGWNTVTMDRRNETETEIEIENECPNMAIQAEHACFRGVHDDIISMHEVDQALGLGNHLILTGGDHFDVYYDVSYLNQRIPSVVSKLQRLLRERYNQYNIQPVAFRIHTAGPMDFYGVNLFQGPALTLNQTTYLDWVEKCKRQNELALYSPPWPFRVPPVRDSCKLIADLEADPRFAIHTSVFLADGAGMEFRGGVTLYTDNHRSNYKPRQKIRRGVTIDSSKGRVVVSSGGIENRRCRLPTRAGLRTVLQIWWDCTGN